MRLFFISTISVFFFISCGVYSFQGVSLPPEIKTFNVRAFDNKAGYVVIGHAQQFTDLLTDKIRNDTRLVYQERKPDIEFKGSITSFRVTAEAPTSDSEVAAINRLKIAIQIEYNDNLDDENDWTKTFTDMEDFNSSQNLSDVQDELIELLNEKLIDQIFRETFTKNW